MTTLQNTLNLSPDTFILSALLADGTLWQVHNCRLLQCMTAFDVPQSLLAHYQGLDEAVQADYPLSFETLRRLDETMSADLAAALIGVDKKKLKPAWQIKYIGRVVFFCETLKLAVRVHFSNTSKPSQAVHTTNQAQAWQSQVAQWRAFGVVEVLYKGEQALASYADEVWTIAPSERYQALPNLHSLAILAMINDNKQQMVWLDTAITDKLSEVNLADDLG